MTTFSPILHTALALAVAFVLGGAIGLERQLRQRTAGLRTNVLVAVGAAAFVDLGAHTAGSDGAARVISYVVSGIGFLGAGVIMKDGTEVRGLNTAATLWASAAVGAVAGTGEMMTSVVVAAFVLLGNTLLRPLVNFVDRRPIASRETEALYRVHLVCRPEGIGAARDLLFEELEAHHYPVLEVESLSESAEFIELAAILIPTSADPTDLDHIVNQLQGSEGVESASWTVSANA